LTPATWMASPGPRRTVERGPPEKAHYPPVNAVRRIHPRETYGKNNEYAIEAGYDAVEFTWQEGLALFPRIKPLDPALADLLKKWLEGRSGNE